MKRHTRDQLPHVLSQVALAALATVIVASLLLATVGPNSFGDVVGRLGRLARTQAGQLAAPAPVPPDAANLEPGWLHRYEAGALVRAMKVPV